MKNKEIDSLNTVREILIEVIQAGSIYRIPLKKQLFKMAQQENSYSSTLKNILFELIEGLDTLLKKVEDWRYNNFNLSELKRYLQQIKNIKINKISPIEEIKRSISSWENLIKLIDEQHSWLGKYFERDEKNSQADVILKEIINRGGDLKNSDQRVIFYKEVFRHLFTNGRADLQPNYLTDNNEEIREAAMSASKNLQDLQDIHVESDQSFNSSIKLGSEEQVRKIKAKSQSLYKNAAQNHINGFLEMLEEEENFTKEAADYAGRQFPDQPSLPTTVNYPYLDERGNYSGEQILKEKQWLQKIEKLKKIRDHYKKEAPKKI